MVVSFLILFLFCTIIDLFYRRYRKIVLLMLSILLTFIVGFRDPNMWADTDSYLYAYNYTPSIFDFSFSNEYVLEKYREEGFMFLSSIVKTITNSGTLYLTIVSAITMFFLYKTLQRYCIYPLMGLCIYISRFFLGRDMMQIRSALAFMILIYFIRYLSNREYWKYFFVVMLATSIHYSSIVFLLPILIYHYHLTNKTIMVTLMLILLSTLLSAIVVNYILNIPEISVIARTSVFTDENSYGYSIGFKNPMIYYQLVILVVYVFLEKKISLIDPNYYVFRMVYLLGFFVLVFFNVFAVLAGRLSTAFCTFEIIMIPSIIYVFPPKVKKMASYGIIIFFSLLFYLNLLTKLPS